MSLQDIILNGLNNLNSDGDLRGAFQHIINSGVGSGNEHKGWHPPVDIIDTNNNLFVYIELPGVSTKSITVDFCNNKLSISGKKIKKHNVNPLKNELIYGKFNRNITLPISVINKDNVIIKYSKGVLSIIIDKRKEEDKKFQLGITCDSDSNVDDSSTESLNNNF